jgi:hypothetical protein
MFPSCFYDARLERGNTQGTIKIDFRLKLRIFQRRWACDELYRARRWRSDNGGRFMGRLAGRRYSLIRRLSVLANYKPPSPQKKINSSRIRSDKATRFHLAHHTISLSSSSFLGPVRPLTFINHSSRLQTLHKTINYRMVSYYLSCHHYIDKTCL